MYTEAMKREIEKEFQSFLQRIGEFKNHIVKQLEQCSEKEAVVMKYLYTTMSYSDVANYSFDVYLDYARHGIYLWENSSLVKGLPPFIFWNYVLHYRVSVEEVVPCRSFFYNEMKDVISEESVKKAITDINYWCAGEVTYQSTDDRCASAMAVYRSGIGRCGEESNFAVHALRSMGIPARQVYAPYWSHCDDNHAWVEVFADGSWYFLGACEPEEELNHGWFNQAASRAVLVHSRLFLPYGYQEEIEGEEFIGKQGCVTMLNQTFRYADVEELKIRTVNEQGQALVGTEVVFQVFNYAAFAEIARMKTGEDGTVSLHLGKGTVRIQLRNGKLCAEKEINLEEQKEETVILSDRNLFSHKKELDCIAPKERENFIAQSKESIREQNRKEKVKEKQEKKESSFAPATEKFFLVNLFESNDDQASLEELVTMSRGNFKELTRFLKNGKDTADRTFRLELLKLLTEKDLRDFQADILEKHISSASRFQYEFPEGIFIKYLLNPRIQWEPIRAYRNEIAQYLGESQIEQFRKSPQKIITYLDQTIMTDETMENPMLITTPAECLKLKKAEKLSKNILAVAICRTIGIPARLHPVESYIEYYRNGKFQRIDSKNKNTKDLILEFPAEEQWIYGENWSLSRYDGEENEWKKLRFIDIKPDQAQQIQLKLSEGDYRLIASNRFPNGNVRISQYDICLRNNILHKIKMKKVEPSDMLVQVALPKFCIKDEKNHRIESTVLLENSKNLIIWLDDGEEPTEHILNELCEHQTAIHSFDLRLILILPKPGAPYSATLEKTLRLLPKAEIWYADDENTAENLARKMYVAPDKLPLIILTDQKGNGIYSTSGYNVGTGMMLIKLYAFCDRNAQERFDG